MNRRIVLAALPAGRLAPSHFAEVEAPLPVPGPGEVLCRTLLASLDPVNRAQMRGRTYREGLDVGDVMPAFTVSELPDGTIVAGEGGWQEYAALPARSVVPLDVRGPLTHHLSVLGLNGLTAYFGLLEVGRVRAGETVVVSAAAGATGNVAGQLARIHGARVVGIAGSERKRRVLEERLGFAATADHRSPTLSRDLRELCPGGIDVYFDNVGGPVLDAVLPRMNPHGRIVCCGTLSAYDAQAPPPGPRAVPALLISRRLRMEGFVVLDYAERRAEAVERLSGWVESGELVVLEEVVEGLSAAPAAYVDLLAGGNLGKRMVSVARPRGPGSRGRARSSPRPSPPPPPGGARAPHGGGSA
jgi:NADPH-dependent curcumin reductase CurA